MESQSKEVDENPTNKLTRIKTLAKETSLIGLHSFIHGDTYVKLIWMFFYLVFIGFTIFLVVNNITTYLNYGVITTVREVNQIPMDFPTVTICNLNILQNTQTSAPLITELASFFNLSDPLYSKSYTVNQYFLLYLNKNVNNLTKNEIQPYGYNLSDTLMFCVYNLIYCSYRDFEWFFHIDYGNCYQFNTGRNGNPTNTAGGVNQQSVHSGSNVGFSIEIFVGVPSVLEDVTENMGLAVFVHPNTTSPLSLQPVMASPNQETNIAVSKTVSQKQPQPYSNCQDIDSVKSYLKDVFINRGIDYNQQDCITNCYQMFLIEKCKCYDTFYLNYVDNITFPCNFDQYSCLNETYFEVYKSGSFIAKNCIPLCPLECSSTQYGTSLSYDLYPTITYETKLLKSGSVKNVYNASEFSQPLRYNIARVNVYFDSLSYTEIVETPAIDAITLLSNIGGSLGLVIGVSLATIIELLEFGVKILLITLDNRKHKNTRANSRKRSKKENSNETQFS